MEIISYELKYCERCGTLKLRPIDSGSTYCRHCEGMLARYKFPRGRSDTNAAALPSEQAVTILAQAPLRAVTDRIAGIVK
jgi:hypothetical protein